MKFFVTDHALQRWRERVAIAGDEKVNQLLDSLGEAVKLQGQPPKGFSCYRNGETIFILKTDEYNRSFVITVINDKKIVNIQEEDDENIFNSLPDVIAKREWLKSELKKILGLKGSCYKKRRKWIECKFKETKHEFDYLNLAKKMSAKYEKQLQKEEKEWEQWYMLNKK